AFLFGPIGILPTSGVTLSRGEPPEVPSQQPRTTGEVLDEPRTSAESAPQNDVAPAAAEETSAETGARPLGTGAALVLGNTITSDKPVQWGLQIRGNPHLMIVGRPGMGKTTCIVSLCAQLSATGLVPILFSYHPDLEARLEPVIGPLTYME